MIRLALMVVVLCCFIAPTVQRSCTIISTGEECLKQCCGEVDVLLLCIDSCVGFPCSSSVECDSSCCRNGSCTNDCPTAPPGPTGTTTKKPVSWGEWYKYVAPFISIAALIGIVYAVYKLWWVPRLRRLAAAAVAAVPANIMVIAVVNDDQQTASGPPPHKR